MLYLILHYFFHGMAFEYDLSFFPVYTQTKVLLSLGLRVAIADSGCLYKYTISRLSLAYKVGKINVSDLAIFFTVIVT